MLKNNYERAIDVINGGLKRPIVKGECVAYQAPSEAEAIATLVGEFNALLEKFIVSGIMQAMAVAPEAAATELFGKAVSALQTDVAIVGNAIEGTLAYVEDYTGFSGDPKEQKGNYLALKFAAPEGATVKVGVVGEGTPRYATLDSDMNIVIRVINKDVEKVVVLVTESNGNEHKYAYALAGLTCEAPAGD